MAFVLRARVIRKMHQTDRPTDRLRVIADLDFLESERMSRKLNEITLLCECRVNFTVSFLELVEE